MTGNGSTSYAGTGLPGYGAFELYAFTGCGGFLSGGTMRLLGFPLGAVTFSGLPFIDADVVPLLPPGPGANFFISFLSFGNVVNYGMVTSASVVTPVPEPSSILLFGSGVAASAWRARRRRRSFTEM
jgi:hypothetical protein